MSKPLSLIFALLLPSLLSSACAQGALTPEGRSINHASKRLVKSFVDVEQRFYQQARLLRVRLNSSRCSDVLKYDVHLRGNWRRVAITGQERALKDFERRAKKAGNAIFEAHFLLLHQPFLTPQNQNIYWLEVFDEEDLN